LKTWVRIPPSRLKFGYPACSVWVYKDESVNGAHDGTYAEKIRKDSIINQNAASHWSTTVPHMDGQVGSTPTGGTNKVTDPYNYQTLVSGL